MSDAHSHDDGHEANPQGPIRTPKQLVAAVIFAFVIPIVTIVLLVMFVDSSQRHGAGSELLAEQAVAKRIAPVGRVEVKDTSDAAALKTGAEVFAAQCSACHAAGVAGAPKFGDKAAWGPRVGQGVDTLVQHVVAGKGAMPPKGGAANASEGDIRAAVQYMVDAAK